MPGLGARAPQKLCREGWHPAQAGQLPTMQLFPQTHLQDSWRVRHAGLTPAAGERRPARERATRAACAWGATRSEGPVPGLQQTTGSAAPL